MTGQRENVTHSFEDKYNHTVIKGFDYDLVKILAKNNGKTGITKDIIDIVFPKINKNNRCMSLDELSEIIINIMEHTDDKRTLRGLKRDNDGLVKREYLLRKISDVNLFLKSIKSPFSIKCENGDSFFEVIYDPDTVAFILINVVPGFNEETIKNIDKLAMIERKEGKYSINSIYVIMGGEDILVNVSTREPSQYLDVWIVNRFQTYLKKNCVSGNFYYIKNVRTIRAMNQDVCKF